MQKVKLTYKNPKAEIENGKPVVKFDVVTENYLVASTKSFNNLIDELKKQGKVPTSAEKVDFFLDDNKVKEIIKNMVDTLVSDEIYRKPVFEHIVKALDGACVFKKVIVRKKS